MAITTGHSVTQSDLVVKGGVKHILITEYATCTFSAATSGSVDWTTSATDNKIFNFEFELETANWSWTSTSERGSTIVEHTVSFYVPNMKKETMQKFAELENVPILCVVALNNNKTFVIGHSDTYKGTGGTGTASNQMMEMITSIEGN